MHGTLFQAHGSLLSKTQGAYMRFSSLQFPISGGMVVSLFSFSHNSCTHAHDSYIPIIHQFMRAGMKSRDCKGYLEVEFMILHP